MYLDDSLGRPAFFSEGKQGEEDLGERVSRGQTLRGEDGEKTVVMDVIYKRRKNK